MKTIFYLLTMLSLLPFFTGCEGSAKKTWKDLKVSELINKQQPSENKFMSVSLHIYQFQINADKLAQIQYQIEDMEAFPIKYNDPDAFSANGLTACCGDRKAWQKTPAILS